MSNPVIVQELKRIAQQHGGELKPADVVQAARPIDSPLHSRFEWDDTAAAESYRLWQARQLIRVVVEYVGSGKEAILSKVFVSLTSDRMNDGGGYRDIVSVMQDPQHRSQLLEDAREDMERFAKKYSELKELSDVFTAMKKAIPRTRRSRRAEVSA